MLTDETVKYLQAVRDGIGVAFLSDTLKKGKTISIPSLDAEIIPLKCGECDGNLKVRSEEIPCLERQPNPNSICLHGRGITIQNEPEVSVSDDGGG